MKKGTSLTVNYTIVGILILLVILISFASRNEAGGPIVDFFRNLVEFDIGSDVIEYDPAIEFKVFDEFGSLYPAIRVNFHEGIFHESDVFIFRWDRFLNRAEALVDVNHGGIDSEVTTYYWLTHLGFEEELGGDHDVTTKVKNHVRYILVATSEDDMFERIATVSEEEIAKIDFPVVASFPGGDEYTVKPGDIFKLPVPVATPRYALRDIENHQRGIYDSISAEGIRRAVLASNEYFIYYIPGEKLEKITTYIDPFTREYMRNARPECERLNRVPRTDQLGPLEYLYSTSVSTTYAPSVKERLDIFEWDTKPSENFERVENVIFIRRKGSFYENFLCHSNVRPDWRIIKTGWKERYVDELVYDYSFDHRGIKKIDDFWDDHVSRTYITFKADRVERKLKDGTPYP